MDDGGGEIEGARSRLWGRREGVGKHTLWEEYIGSYAYDETSANGIEVGKISHFCQHAVENLKRSIGTLTMVATQFG